MWRTRDIEPALHGGHCDDNETLQVAECNEQPCSKECALGQWGEWDDCDVDCGEGQDR